MKPILVVSHERSGTHFLINTIAVNFGLSNEVLNLPGGDPTAVALDTATSPELIRKSHHQAHWFGERIQDVIRENTVFYVIRDCRGVLVSLYHYFISTRGIPEFPCFERLPDLIDACPSDYPFDAAYSKVKASNFPQRWALHIESWEPHFGDICVVTYADLSKRLPETVWRIAAHLKRCPVGDIRRPDKRLYSVAPYRGVFNGWQTEMRQRDSARVWRMVRRHERWLTA